MNATLLPAGGFPPLAGVVTDRLPYAILDDGRDASRLQRIEEAEMGILRVRDLMTEAVFSLNPEDDLLSLKGLMTERNCRHVPVVDHDGDLVGLVSLRDLMQATHLGDDELPLSTRNDLLHCVRVDAIMTRDVATIGPDDDLQEAAQIMFENKFGCLPVVVGNRLVGILTEADFVRYHIPERVAVSG